jgi:dynein heavy chain
MCACHGSEHSDEILSEESSKFDFFFPWRWETRETSGNLSSQLRSIPPLTPAWLRGVGAQVLDDNKKLCLMSGEIIQMSATMNMIFEVADLAVASPATVSRVGMIYVEPTQMGWEPLMLSWLNTLPPAVAEHRSLIQKLFEWMVTPCIKFVRRNCKELIPTPDVNLPVSLMNIFDSLLDRFKLEPCGVKAEDQREQLESIFLFACVWSLGGSTDGDGRAKFSVFFRALIDGKVDVSEERTDFDLGPGITLVPGSKPKVLFPKEGVVYDFSFDAEKGGFSHWLSTVEVKPIDAETQFQQIVVTTIDTVRYKALLEMLLLHGRQVLFGGPTGTGKTVYIKDLLESLDKTAWMTIQSTFSAQTNANMIQVSIGWAVLSWWSVGLSPTEPSP